MGKVKRMSGARAERTERDAQADVATNFRASTGDDAAPPKGFDFPLFDRGGSRLSEADLAEATFAVAPWASAGDYRRAFVAMGCTKVVAFDTTSSAGDWGFIVKRAGCWYMASQENRYPRGPGFDYGISEEEALSDDNVLCHAELATAVEETIATEDPDYIAAYRDGLEG